MSAMLLVLAKIDLTIATRYAALVPDEALRQRTFACICDEHDRAGRDVERVQRAYLVLPLLLSLASACGNHFAPLEANATGAGSGAGGAGGNGGASGAAGPTAAATFSAPVPGQLIS